MDITITWTDGGGVQPTDGWNILYREHTPTNTNNWILATDPDLPPTPTQYTLTGLTPNVIYDIAVVKSCNSVFDFVSQKTYVSVSCPIVSTWQGPVVNGKPTLFYSVYYEEGSDISGTAVRLYDSTPISFQLTNAIGNGLSILFTTGVVHDFKVGSEVTVSGVNPSSYNGTYEIVSKTATAFVVDSPNTGLYVSGGTATYQPGMLEDIQPYSTVNSVVGKTNYQVIDPAVGGLPFIQVTNCGTDALAFNAPNSTNSVAGYFGTEHSNLLPTICNASIGQNGPPSTYNPILLNYNTTFSPREYKLGTNALLNDNSVLIVNRCAADSIVEVTTSFTFDDDASQLYRNLNVANSANISAAICFDTVTGIVDYTLGDGLGRTNINDYVFSFTTSDGAAPLFPLLDNAGNPVTSYNGSYNIYAPVKIESAAPGGGNLAGYTITNAVSSGSNTTYTYTGGTNAFTVGQEVFISNVNPNGFNFSSVFGFQFSSRTITAATSNTFTIAFNTSAAGLYQTGGIVTGYAELTDDMTITVDLLPGPVNVITLTNQNYAGFTLKEVLDDIVSIINTTTSYTALSVIVAGLPYIKIGVPGTAYTSASVKFEGPNIITKGTPDILITSNPYPSYSTASYNGYLYTATGSPTAKITRSDPNNPTVTTDYNHDIDITVTQIAVIPLPPPTTVYSLDYVTSGGDYSLNIALDTTTGYSYSANNTTVSVYDGKILIDSQDLSLLPLGPTTPIRLMEFNTTDNTLYVFVDSSGLDNFYIVDVAPWSIVASGVYGQTNYLKTGIITAWNNLAPGNPLTAMGTIDVDPSSPSTIPIPSSIIPYTCIAGGPVSTPCGAVPAWSLGTNDGVRSALFQDTTQNWTVAPPGSPFFGKADYNVYNYDTQKLGAMVGYSATSIYNPSYGVSGNTVKISAAIDPTPNLASGLASYSAFTANLNDAFGFFHNRYIVDYTATFQSRTWSNLSRYLITEGRNGGANGFLNTASPYNNNTLFDPDLYVRSYPVALYNRGGDKQIYSGIGLDGTSNYLLFDITDGGTCYNSTSNFVYISLDGGLYEAIDNLGNVLSYQLYKDFTNPSPSNPVQVPLQMVADPNSDLVYGIVRDARSDVDDMNIYVFTEHGQVDVIDGSALWNVPISGQISIDSEKLYFTGKYNRTFYEYDLTLNTWVGKAVPSLYEKIDGAIYGDGTMIERVQGASYMGGGKFVVMNYLQQTFSTNIKYMYDVANLFVYDFTNNTVEQALIGTGVNTYSGSVTLYNENYHGEGFGINDYNNDYCYGGLGIKVDSNTGRIYWKKSISDQVYFSEAHTESGIAQIWGTGNLGGSISSSQQVNAHLVRIWNIQSDGSLQASKRTILDYFSNLGPFYDLQYDSFYEKLIISAGNSRGSGNFYLVNPQTLGGLHGVNSIGPYSNYNFGSIDSIAGLAPSVIVGGKDTVVYNAIITTVGSTSEITYYVKPAGAPLNGYYPHKYAVGEVVKISNIISTSVPNDSFNVPNSNTTPTTYAIIKSVTPVTFTIDNLYGATGTYVSGGRVVDAEWVNLYSNGYTKLSSDNNGTIVAFGSIPYTFSASPGINTVGSSFMVKFTPSDILTQRENKELAYRSIVSTPVCSATPNGLYPLAAPGSGTSTHSYFIHIPSQNVYWVLGSKNPDCSTYNITGATYNAGTQTVRYNIINSFSVGKVVNISGVLPSTYNVLGVTITAVDTINSPQQWFEISYTGPNPGTFDPLTTPSSNVKLAAFYIIKVIDDTTFTDVATIDLGFMNSYIDYFLTSGIFYSDGSRFQYSPSTEEVYVYSASPTYGVYIFSTITNSLVRSSNFARMVLPYNKLTTVNQLQDVNGVPYFNAYTSTDTPTTRRWFKVIAGDRKYQDDVHNVLNVSTTDVVGTTTTSYDIYNLTNMSDTFGQWKEITDTTWATIPSAISVTLGTRLEFVSFIIDKPLVEIRNLTQATTFAITSTSGLPLVTMLIDGIAVVSGDVLEFEFTNPANPSCPFINQTTITII